VFLALAASGRGDSALEFFSGQMNAEDVDCVDGMEVLSTPVTGTATRKRKPDVSSTGTDKTVAWEAIAAAMKPKDSPARELVYVEQAKKLGGYAEELGAYNAASDIYKQVKDMEDNGAPIDVVEHIRKRAKALMSAQMSTSPDTPAL
jgi:cell division septation protein DedD